MKEFLIKKRYLIIIMLLLSICLVLLSIIPTNYDVTTPGYLNEVNSVIDVDTKFTETGSFNTTSVYVKEKCSVLTYLLAHLSKSSIIEKTSEVIDGTSIRNSKSGIIQKETSITNSIICAYQQAGKEISHYYGGIIIHSLATYAPNDLNVGDIISKVNGKTFNSEHEFLTLYNETRLSDEFFDKENKTCNLPLTINGVDKIITTNVYDTLPNGEIYPIFGFYYYDYNVIVENSANPSYSLNKANTTGPSGGLMQALSVFNSLTEKDYTYGLKIAGTGTIEADGRVGAIGGMYSKIFTAYYSKADIFFVPYYESEDYETNYEEALRAYQDLGSPNDFKIVPVSTFEEAVNYLILLGDHYA